MRRVQALEKTRVRLILLPTLLILLSGCWNASNEHLHLGDVSLGQQLIDLKQAREADAITNAEYDSAKAALLGTADLCQSDDEA